MVLRRIRQNSFQDFTRFHRPKQRSVHQNDLHLSRHRSQVFFRRQVPGPGCGGFGFSITFKSRDTAATAYQESVALGRYFAGMTDSL